MLIGLLALRGLFRGAVRGFARAHWSQRCSPRTLDLPLARALEPLLIAHSPLAVRVLAMLLVAGAIVVVSGAGSLLRRGLHAARLGSPTASAARRSVQ